MADDPTYHLFPEPQTEPAGENNILPGSGYDPYEVAEAWTPKGAKESPLSTITRFAHRVVDAEGNAYTAEQLGEFTRGELGELAAGGAAVESLDDLRALSGGAELEQCFVRCHTIAGDGGHGVFRWEAAADDTDNNGTIIRPDEIDSIDPGRWMRLCDPLYLNVAWFGMRPGQLCNVPLQATLDALPIVPGLEAFENIPSGRAPRKGTVYIPAGNYPVSATIYQSWGTTVEFANSQNHGAASLDLVQGTWTNPAEPQYMWYVDQGPSVNLSFSTRIINMSLIGRGCPLGWNTTGSNSNPNTGAMGIHFHGAEHCFMENCILSDFSLTAADLSGVYVVDRLAIGDVEKGPALIVRAGVHLDTLNLGHWNAEDFEYTVGGVNRKIPALLVVGCIGLTIESVIGEIASNTSEVIHFQGCSANSIGSIYFASNPGAVVIREYDGTYGNQYGPIIAGSFQTHVLTEELNAGDGATNGGQSQEIPANAFGPGAALRYASSGLFSMLRAWRRLILRGDGTYVPQFEIDGAGGTFHLDFRTGDQAVLNLKTTNHSNVATAKGSIFRYFAGSGDWRVANDDESTVLLYFSYSGDLTVSRSLGITAGPFADDTGAASGGIPVGHLYRKSGGSVAWRQS